MNYKLSHCYSCREKRIEQIDELEGEKSQEYRDMEDMDDDNNSMREELERLKGQFSALKQFAMAQKIALPHELLATV